MIPGGVTPRIYASQNDHGLRVFVFNLVDENGGYAIPSGTTALLNVLKPDRTVVSETCTWSGSTVTADCTEQMTAVAGNVHCEVRLVAANGDAVGSANFILGVESNPLASGVVSESDFDSISDMVDRAVAAASIPPTYVTDWLDENITQETGYVIDKSLTIENAAADAKAAGDLIRASFVVGEASGSIASFTDGADGVPLKDLVVNITPKQAGTGDPSPSNVRAISGWTEANITRTGKNLVNENNWDSGHTISATGVITSNGSFKCSNAYMGILPNTKYTLQLDKNTTSDSGLSAGTFIAEYDASFNFLRRTQIIAGGTATGTITGTYTSHASARFAKVSVYIGSINVQLEQGTAATEYEAYNGNVYNVSFGSAGTVYGGTLDVTSGMLTIDYKTVNMTSSMTWAVENSGMRVKTGSLASEIVHNTANSTTVGVYCNMFAERTPNQTWAGGSTGIGVSVAPNGDVAFCQTGSQDMGYSAWIAYINANTIQLVYPLAQPVSYQLTPTEVKTLLGNNNIWSDTGSVASCEYRADTKLYLEKLTNPDDDMVANANITSGSYFMVGNSLYLATANIANGGAITPGTNCTATNLAAALNAINS